MWQANQHLFKLSFLLFLSTFTLQCYGEVGSGLLWRIHKPQHPVSYLFGTIHVDDKRVKQLNSTIKRRFDESKTLCLEILPDRETQVGIGLAMLLPDKQSLDDILGEGLFNRLSLALNRLGISPLEAIRLKPWAAMIVLSRPASTGGYALDEQLYHWGNHQYKQLCALESLQEQLAIFDELSHEDQISLLRDTLDNVSELKDLNEKLILAYLSGNLDEIHRQSLKMEGGNSELGTRLRERLIDSRNEKMAIKLINVLEKGNAFIAVGALHLPGEKGLLQLLRDRGYIVTPPTIQISPW
jgi:uncharacterized protein YbaP (TraB family)